MRPELRDPGGAPTPPPRVVTLLGLYSLLGLLCLPALPVAMATAALLRTWTRVRPVLVAAVAAVALAGELAAWRSPLFGGNLLSFHLSGWAMFSLTHPHVDVAFWRMVFEAPVGLPLGVLLGAVHMLHSDHATRGLPWHPRTVQRTPPATPAPAARWPGPWSGCRPSSATRQRSGRSMTGSCRPGSTAPMRCCRGSCAAGRSLWPAPPAWVRRCCSAGWSLLTRPVAGGWYSSTPRPPSPPWPPS